MIRDRDDSGTGGGEGERPGATVPVAVGLGSNLGDRAAHLAAGVGALARLLADLSCSRVYETRPVGVGDQPPFLNMCCVGRTRTPPRALLRALLEAERKAGRTRDPEATGAPGPRTLDLDLLLYGDEEIDEPGLRVPHPRMAGRAFVLVPLAEVARGWRHPGSGLTVGELAGSVATEGVEPWGGSVPDELERRMGG